MKVRKAVIVAAGWGTRFLPVTKSIPKEMLPLLNKPLIHYAVEELVNSGIKQVVIVTAPGKQAIEDYFDYSHELDSFLRQKGRAELYKELHRLTRLADISYVRQEERLGLGHAILMARDAIGDEPFFVLLPDDIIDGKVPAAKQLLAVYDKYKTNVLAVERINKKDTVRYGIIEPKVVSEGIYRVLGLVEKPTPQEAPSNLAIVGRYILMPPIFRAIEATPPGSGGELQLTDALGLLLEQQNIYARELDGVRHDTGTPLGWLKGQIALTLKHPRLGPELEEYLRRIS